VETLRDFPHLCFHSIFTASSYIVEDIKTGSYSPFR
jgi:hypothetical protein